MKVNRGSISALPISSASFASLGPVKKPEPLNSQVLAEYDNFKNTLKDVQKKIDELTLKKDEINNSIDNAKKGGISFIIMKRMDDLKVVMKQLEIEEERYQKIEKDNSILKIKIDAYNDNLNSYNYICKLEEEIKEFNRNYIENKVYKEHRYYYL